MAFFLSSDIDVAANIRTRDRSVNIARTPMTDETRPYRMQRRAESQQQTRQRIAESAVFLHGTLGPARTSISAVAAHAGVRRSTVYRHFPDETALFDACSAHWRAANPAPDPAGWAGAGSPDARMRIAVGELYAYYGRTADMLDNLFRDESTVPLIRDRFAAFHGYLGVVRDILMAGRGLRGRARRRTQAAIGHVIAFQTWKSLVREQGLVESDAVEVACRIVAAAG
jgi:AcrR family transcriptional regulator